MNMEDFKEIVLNKNFGRYLIVTIDTEGDNCWAVSDIRSQIGTENAKYLPRFQELCEKYGFIPTYLTNYEMANDPSYKEFGSSGLREGKLEIGAHEHAWNQPPYFPLVKKPGKIGKPFLHEYPTPIIKEKLKVLTTVLEDTFCVPVRSHRGGRWSLSPAIVRELDALGYVVDCTCTPCVDWSVNPGWSPFKKGVDWSTYERNIMRLDYFDGFKKKKSKVIEIPVTIKRLRNNSLIWMRPNGTNRTEMLHILKDCHEKEEGYVEFMIHSSELMPGGSPTFSNKGKIEHLYRDLDEVFSYAKELGYRGIGLSDYAEKLM